jgi:phosphatidylglycerol:prolipoprotein diacylglycerol transferase
MLQYPDIHPVLLHLGPLQVRWYGLMYVLGFTASYFLVKQQLKTFKFKELQVHFENLNIVLILSLIIGGRLGYVIFYNLPYYLEHPLEIPATWSGGMSFHGATIGLLIGGFIFCKLKNIDFWKAADIYVVTIPIGLGLGRLGNFINGELIGRATDLPWGMVFPGGGLVVRHPSQIYEALLEGLLLFILLWLSRRKPWGSVSNWPHGSLLALFLIGYGILRFLVEFTREPDRHIGLVLDLVSMGQILSSIMILSGILLWVWSSGVLSANRLSTTSQT